MKAIIVARVSTEEQKIANNSLPAQEQRIASYFTKKGFDVIKTFSFDESAYKEKRDEFDKLLADVQELAKTEKVAVGFDKVDRLSRSVFDKRVGALYEMAVADRIELHFVSDGQVINNQMSAVEKFQFGMSLGLAKYYSDAIGDNVKRAFEQKRRNGAWTGMVRVGYKNVTLDDAGGQRKDIILDPERAYLVKVLFELYATGNHSIRSLWERITEMGLRGRNGKQLSRSNIENIIKDPFYCGTAVSKKYGAYAHKYPRLITRELFDKCQEIRLKRKANPNKPQPKVAIFQGLLICQNCGCAMSPDKKVKKSGVINMYYVCTNSKRICKRVWVNEKVLLKPIYEVLDRFAGITERVQSGLVEELRQCTEAEVAFHQAQVNRIRNEYEQLKQKDDRLLEMYLEQGITKDVYDKKHQEYQDRLQILTIELSEHTNADYEYQTTVATVVSLARRAREVFGSSEPAEKKALLNYLLQNPTVNEKTLVFTLRSPFNLVLQLADNPVWGG